MPTESLSDHLDSIDQFVADIRSILANGDYSDQEGISDVLRDARIRLENIEGQTQRIREENDL